MLRELPEWVTDKLGVGNKDIHSHEDTRAVAAAG